jgi:nucleotide-binding universal stress UspA family protein
MKVLVAIDDSQYSTDAIEQLGARPWWGDTQFLLLHVTNIPSVQQWRIWGLEVDWAMREKVLAQAQTMVDDQAGLLTKLVTKGIEIKSKIAESEDHIAERIVKEAEDWDADLIVTGSHGRTGVKKFLLGSVAESVLMQAPCSVEIIRSLPVTKHDQPKKVKDTSMVVY